MRFADLIVLSLILGLFSTVFAEEISSLRKMDLRIEQLQTENDCLTFISESFYSTCQGRGFASLEEWKKVCGSLWKLESIDWKLVPGKAWPDEKLICGSWIRNGSEKKVYYRINKADSNETKL